MDPAISSKLTVRRSLVIWAAFALLLVAFSYVFTLLVAAACVYLPFLLVANYPEIQTLICFLGGIVIGLVILWSLVPRRDKFLPPGPRLSASEHPRLFSEIASIAKALNEPMPCEVYLIPDVNAWVAERGGVMGFGSRRVMGLGLSLIRVLTVSQFRAVLAHEFGHFYSGDTRLWPWVHKTRAAMARTLVNLSSDSLAEAFSKIQAASLLHHLAVGGLVAYWKLFMRATQAVSRRHEYRADELASLVAGPQALTDGLRSMHGAAAALRLFFQREMFPAMAAGCRPALADGFAYYIGVPGIAKAISVHLQTQLLKTSIDPYDTHPPLQDRIAAVDGLNLSAQTADNTCSITLLDSVDQMELQLLRAMLPQMNVASLPPVSWERIGSEIYVPAWKERSAQYAALLTGYTLERLPEVVAKLNEIAPQIRDSKAMLLTREQRVEQTALLLVQALGVALWDNGWQSHAAPGELYFQHGEYKIAPAEIVAGIRSGAVKSIDWSQLCMKAGICGIPLVPAAS
jgi:heat shock protein HtpX